MPHDKIPFTAVKAEVERILSLSTTNNWELVPDSINKLANSAGIQLQWTKIDWWSSFEYGHKDISNEEFFSVLFPLFVPKDNQVIIVTDECFEDKFAYSLNFQDLPEFVANRYPEIHQMDFFQPHDFLFIFPVDGLLIVLHHEGFVMHYQNSQHC
jgi:hypothetical protein